MMIDYNFTDEQVIKALECCEKGCACTSCPLEDDYSPCSSSMAHLALSLINKQKNDIDLLKSTITHKEEETYNKGYTDAKKSILMDLKAIMQIIILDYKHVGAFDNAEIVGYVRDHLLAELEKRHTEGEDKPTASEEKYFSPEDVRKMTNQEVREKYTAIRRSMERW